MGTKIYVGNLLYEVTDDELRQLFSTYGEVVSAEIVRYKKSKRSKGFGYVKMGTAEAAQQAIAALNTQDYRGRKLFLELAKSEDPPAEVMQELRQTKTSEMSHVAHEAQSAQEEQMAQQQYEEVQQQQIEQPPVTPAEPQNFTSTEHLQKSGTIFSGNNDKQN